MPLHLTHTAGKIAKNSIAVRSVFQEALHDFAKNFSFQQS